MRYISGQYALNIPCALATSGDWHFFALDWSQIEWRDTGTAFFGDYGLELHANIPGVEGDVLVADHIRACLDLIADGRFGLAQGMREDFITNDSLNREIFAKVAEMRNLIIWRDIDRFMGSEYRTAWLVFKQECQLPVIDEFSEVRSDPAAQKARREVMADLLRHLNRAEPPPVLKGHGALSFCFGMDCAVTELDLDGDPQAVRTMLERWAALHGCRVTGRIAKAGISRFIVTGAACSVPEINVTGLRRINNDSCVSLDGIRTYGIDRLALQTAMSYASRDCIDDMISLIFIVKNHFRELSTSTKTAVKEALFRKGPEYFEWMMRTQGRTRLDRHSLENDFTMMKKLCDLL